MISHLAVTTFSVGGWALYGKRFVDSFLKHWDIPLLCYHEGVERPYDHPRLYWADLRLDADREAFMERNAHRAGNPSDPNMQTIRFSHKVFALTNHMIESRWRLWIDADVETIAPVNEDALKEMCPEDCCLSFLGRVQAVWPGQKPYPECGFVGYKVEDPRVRRLLDHMRGTYTSDRLFELGNHNQHDSFVFDHCRQLSGIPANEQHNLSAGKPGLHVWPLTVLGKYMRHSKGPALKQRVYGGIVP